MNENCLKGMQCPKCGSYEPFRINAQVTLTAYDDGTEFNGGDVEWDDDAACACIECGRTGKVRDFTKKKGKKT